MSKETAKVCGIIVLIAVLIITLFLFLTPPGREILNNYFYNLKQTDNATNYKVIKQVEDTCRAMIASYNSDKLVYEQYKDSDNEEKLSWAEQAKMRANKTAATYNEYILKNAHVWDGNVPEDISSQLQYLD